MRTRLQDRCQRSAPGRVGRRSGVHVAVSTTRSRHGVLLAIIGLTVAAALAAATFGAGVTALGLRQLVSGPGVPAGAGAVPAASLPRAASRSRRH